MQFRIELKRCSFELFGTEVCRIIMYQFDIVSPNIHTLSIRIVRYVNLMHVNYKYCFVTMVVFQ